MAKETEEEVSMVFVMFILVKINALISQGIAPILSEAEIYTSHWLIINDAPFHRHQWARFEV